MNIYIGNARNARLVRDSLKNVSPEMLGFLGFLKCYRERSDRAFRAFRERSDRAFRVNECKP